MVAPREGRPGIAKTRELPLIQARVVELWRSSDYRWRELFETADVMSEGATRKDSDGAVYYGTTSIVLSFQRSASPTTDKVLRAISRDPHVRLRAIRVACLEAQLRATGAIGRVHSEFRVRAHERGACIDIEVQANVFISATTKKTKSPSLAAVAPRRAKLPSRRGK